ncbi:hypothetical protein Bca4012_056507 [Brassica carinata]|uniref:Cyclin-like domain-containing protein n=1 Tax=Brassica carinata TaxID=52824 RepID=A0A8X7VYY2_BRACI|nr:hypothetical protein Bca52824_013664 [Brassica carinata]
MSETSWYYTREEIEKTSPSRIDGIDLKQETFQRWSYTTFLQELGQRLNNPQRSIATSIVLCQRFFTRQSLAKNDPKTMSIVCMFIAGKVEGSPRPVGDVIAVAYRVLHDKEPSREVYERLKKTVLTGEKFVLSTLEFDLEIEHPYKPVSDWVKRSVKVERDAKRLSQAAFNFVNDSLRSSLCLQFKPSQIAAAAIYLGSCVANVKLQWDGEKVWWREFSITKRKLREISNQMISIYEQDFLIPGKHEAKSKLGDGELLRPEQKQSKDDETKYCQAVVGHEDHKGVVINGADKAKKLY